MISHVYINRHSTVWRQHFCRGLAPDVVSVQVICLDAKCVVCQSLKQDILHERQAVAKVKHGALRECVVHNVSV